MSFKYNSAILYYVFIQSIVPSIDDAKIKILLNFEKC